MQRLDEAASYAKELFKTQPKGLAIHLAAKTFGISRHDLAVHMGTRSARHQGFQPKEDLQLLLPMEGI